MNPCLATMFSSPSPLGPPFPHGGILGTQPKFHARQNSPQKSCLDLQGLILFFSTSFGDLRDSRTRVQPHQVILCNHPTSSPCLPHFLRCFQTEATSLPCYWSSSHLRDSRTREQFNQVLVCPVTCSQTGATSLPCTLPPGPFILKHCDEFQHQGILCCSGPTPRTFFIFQSSHFLFLSSSLCPSSLLHCVIDDQIFPIRSSLWSIPTLCAQQHLCLINFTNNIAASSSSIK